MNTILYETFELTPSKIVCIGKNYIEHIKELGDEVPAEPVLFIKPNSAISDQLYCLHEDLHFEGELSFLVMDGRLAGVGFGLDLTRRQIQSGLKSKGLPWERSKAFDHSAVFSKFVKFNGDFSGLRMRLDINGRRVQEAEYKMMIHKPEQILGEIMGIFTLEDGDIIMTGTPKGVGSFSAGDVFHGCIFTDTRLLVEQTWTAVPGISGYPESPFA